jgi:hypothetical protein
LKEAPSISSEKRPPSSMDYRLLRSEAIDNTQNISGDKWTDYNIHDPGVTILEQFCYALTDVAYRTNLSIEDLLFTGQNVKTIARNSALIPAEEIFASSAITESDYRILFLDEFANKISNCWFNRIEPHLEGLKGLYELVVHLTSDLHPSEYDQIKSDLFKFYRSHRNLCEDLESIKILEPEDIQLLADIEIFQDTEAEEIVAEILFQLESYFNPKINFHSLESMKSMGMSLDQIFDIPSYKHGFILKNELKPKQNQFHLSKIEDLIRQVKGVRSVKNLLLFQDGVPVNSDTIKVKDSNFLTFQANQHFISSNRDPGSSIKLYKGGVQNNFLAHKAEALLFQKLTSFNRSYEGDTLTFSPSASSVKKSEIESYDSIQTNFPIIYGVGNSTPPLQEGKRRQSQSSQLKAYLMFFDQIMANHLAQLSHLSKLISTQEIDVSKLKTYFTQSLQNKVNGADELLKKTLRPISTIKGDIEILQNISDINSETFRKKNEPLQKELQQKEKIVKELSSSIYDSLLNYSKAELKRSKLVSDRRIIINFLKLKTDETSPEDSQRILDENKQLIKSELAGIEQQVELTEEELADLMGSFDNEIERKNRLLSHMLARFGEQFSTDFHLKFSDMLGSSESEKIDKRLIELKSEFLKQIGNINKFKAQGINLNSANPQSTSLQKKVNLLLNLPEQRKTSSKRRKRSEKFSIKRISGDELTTDINEKIETPFIKRSIDTSGSDKATFIINSTEYLKYLFQFGLHKNNYKIVQNNTMWEVFFIPPTEEKASLLFVTPSKKEADEKLSSLVQKLIETSKENERFFIVEHILLRPISYRECRFFLKNQENDSIFKSLTIDKEEQQYLTAQDTLILAAYEENYRISKNELGDFIVTIKSKSGKILVESCHSFMTVLKAEEFIKLYSSYYYQSINQSTDNIELDNKVKYFLELLDHNNEALLKSTESSSPGEHNKLLKTLISAASTSTSFEIRKEAKRRYKVALTDGDNKEIAFSINEFSSETEANTYIAEASNYFSEQPQDVEEFKAVRFSKLNDHAIESYNNQLSVVFPDWTGRFNNLEFLEVFKQTIFNCTPAHLSINFMGLDFKSMSSFEKQYAELLDELANVSYENRDKVANMSNQVFKFLVNE